MTSQISLSDDQMKLLASILGEKSVNDSNAVVLEILKRLETQSKQEKHLYRLGQIAFQNGFQGNSGSAMLDFVQTRLQTCSELEEKVSDIGKSVHKLRLSSEQDSPLKSVIAVIEEAAVRISAQRATIEILAEKSLKPKSKP